MKVVTPRRALVGGSCDHPVRAAHVLHICLRRVKGGEGVVPQLVPSCARRVPCCAVVEVLPEATLRRQTPGPHEMHAPLVSLLTVECSGHVRK